VAGDVGRAATVFATGGACLCGLTTGFGLATCGAWTVMLGSWLVGLVAVCDAAVPLSSAVDRIATAKGTTNPDDFMTISSRDVRIVRRYVAASPLKACR